MSEIRVPDINICCCEDCTCGKDIKLDIPPLKREENKKEKKKDE